MPLIVDGHLDLAWNAVAFGRDQTLSVSQLRRQEQGLTGEGRGGAAVSLPELGRAGVGVFVGTLFARARPGTPIGDCLARTDSDSPMPAGAHAAAMAQLSYYRLLERQGRLRILTDATALGEHWAAQHHASTPPGCMILMECADPVTELQEVTLWRQMGVRAISLAHYGHSIHAVGTGATGPLTAVGRQLLEVMAEQRIALDLSHLCDAGFYEAIDRFDGRVLASHTNCRRLCDGDRQFSDEQIRLVAEREGVIGVVMHNGMLRTGWRESTHARQEVPLRRAVEHLDHICQIVGSVEHAAIGSDLDGGFGIEACPAELDTIADLQRLAPLLSERGYRDADIAAIFHGNWLRLWSAVLGDVPQV